MAKDDREAMMPEMMMGMMCGGAGEGSPKMQDMMSEMMPGGPEHEMSQMPDMMLKKMMPHCIGMMLPKIDPDERGEAAATFSPHSSNKGLPTCRTSKCGLFARRLRRS